MFAGPPAREPLIDEAIEVVQRPAAHATEVVARAPNVRIEVGDHRVETQPRLPCLPPQFVADAPQRLRTDVEVQPMEPPPMRVPEKHEVVVSRIEHARLGRVQRQAEPRHQLLQPRERSVRTMRRQQDEIIRIADEAPVQVTSSHPATEVPVEQVQDSRTNPWVVPAPVDSKRLSGEHLTACHVGGKNCRDRRGPLAWNRALLPVPAIGTGVLYNVR